MLKFIYFQFETANKQMMVIFSNKAGKIFIWQKFFKTSESDFEGNYQKVYLSIHKYSGCVRDLAGECLL